MLLTSLNFLLVQSFLNDRRTQFPSNQIFYMIEFLQSQNGVKTYGDSAERKELLKLRKDVTWLRKKKKEQEKEDSETESKKSDSEENDEVLENVEALKAKAKTKMPRQSVSAEAFGLFNKKSDFVAKVIKKTDEEREDVLKILQKSILFGSLEIKEKLTVVDAVRKQLVKLFFK